MRVDNLMHTQVWIRLIHNREGVTNKCVGLIKSLQDGTENIKRATGLIKMDPSLPEGASTGSGHNIIGRFRADQYYRH